MSKNGWPKLHWDFIQLGMANFLGNGDVVTLNRWLCCAEVKIANSCVRVILQVTCARVGFLTGMQFQQSENRPAMVSHGLRWPQNKRVVSWTVAHVGFIESTLIRWYIIRINKARKNSPGNKKRTHLWRRLAAARGSNSIGQRLQPPPWQTYTLQKSGKEQRNTTRKRYQPHIAEKANAKRRKTDKKQLKLLVGDAWFLLENHWVGSYRTLCDKWKQHSVLRIPCPFLLATPNPDPKWWIFDDICSNSSDSPKFQHHTFDTSVCHTQRKNGIQRPNVNVTCLLGCPLLTKVPPTAWKQIMQWVESTKVSPLLEQNTGNCAKYGQKTDPDKYENMMKIWLVCVCASWGHLALIEGSRNSILELHTLDTMSLKPIWTCWVRSGGQRFSWKPAVIHVAHRRPLATYKYNGIDECETCEPVAKKMVCNEFPCHMMYGLNPGCVVLGMKVWTARYKLPCRAILFTMNKFKYV